MSQGGAPAVEVEDEQDERGHARLDRLLDNPLTGFVPWVVLYVVEGPGTVSLACALALFLSITTLALEKVRATKLQLLSFVDVAAFTAFLAGSFLAAPSTIDWFEDWFSTLGNLFLFVVVLGTLIARKPFTLSYAKDQTDPRYWDTPAFRRINDVVTAAWAVAFLVGALAGFFGAFVLQYEDDIWTGWLIQIIAVMVAVAFTAWYGPHTMAFTIHLATGEIEERTPVWGFWANVATYLIPIGVVSLVFDGGPIALSVGLVVAGFLLRSACRWAARRPVPSAPCSMPSCSTSMEP